MNADALVQDYLGRLDAASWPLAPARRDELRAEVAGHIDAALAEAGARDEATVRNVLERLGPPEEIAAADVDPVIGASTPLSTPPLAGGSWGALEILAILFLTLGSIFLPIVGPLVGLVFVWGSGRWTTREKRISTLIVLLLLILPVLLLVGAGFSLFVSSGATEVMP